MNIQEEILKIKNEMLDEFDKRVEALGVEEDEFPQDGGDYWYIDSEGWVIGPYKYKIIDELDTCRLEIGNMFRTESEAKFAREKLKVEAELRKFNIPFKSSYENYTLCYDHEAGELVEVNKLNSFEGAGELYFSSSKEVRNAINAIGADRIKKYIFGVE